MNCNKCGTPILPGENVCRFCGSVNDFSARVKEEPKPEIIDFNINEEVEIVDFMIGEDDVSINPEPKKEFDPNEIIDFSFEDATIKETIEEPIVEEEIVSVVNSVIEEPATARIPVEEVQQYLRKEEDVEETPIAEVVIDATAKDSIDEIPSFEQPVESEIEEQPKEDKKGESTSKNEEPRKEKSSSKIGMIILTMLLIASMVLNCFLLMGRAEAKVDNVNKVSDVSLTSVYNNYEIKLPNNWNVNSTSSEYLLIYDGSENWAASINFQTGLDYSLIEDNISTITDEFGENNYLLISNYTKTVNNKEFYIFKGKYYSYAVYIIVNQVDENTLAVTDLKFVGEVEDDVLNSLLDSLTTVSTKNMNNFLKDNFEFKDISNVLSSVISETE